MKEALLHYGKLGIVHFMACPVIKGKGPILESLEKLASDSFFEALEISWIKDPATREKARALLQSSGVELKYAEVS